MGTRLMKLHMEIKQIDKVIEQLEKKREQLYFQVDEEIEVQEYLANR